MGGWTDYGPDKYLDDKDMHALFKSLNQIQHPFIHSIELCLCTDIGGLVVRSNHKDGSLRDLICGAKPRQSFLKKYGNPKGTQAAGSQPSGALRPADLGGPQVFDGQGAPLWYFSTVSINLN
jgi:hypothetical protein